MPLMRGLLPQSKRSKHRAFSMTPFIGGAAPANYGVLPLKMSALGNDRFGNCHSSDSEVLTSKGWVLWPDYDGSTPLATMNQADGQLEFQSPSRVVRREHDGLMAYSDHRRLDFAMTPKHRMYYRPYSRVRSEYGPYQFGKVDSLPCQFSIPLATSGFLGTTLNRLVIGSRSWDGDDLLSLLAVVISDGCVGPKNTIEFVCFREDRYDMVAGLAFRLGIREKPSQKGVWRFSDGALAEWLRVNSYVGDIRLAPHKRVPDLVKVASQGQIELFLDFFGDQTTLADGCRNFSSTSKRLVDDLQELLLRIGKAGSIYPGYTHKGCFINETWVECRNPCYTLHQAKYREVCLHQVKKGLGASNLRWDHYKGEVFCATVPNSTLVTRRNGHALVSSNCVSAEEFARLQVYSVMRGLAEVVPTDAECIAFARSHGVLNGADLNDVMDKAARDGTTAGSVNYKEGPPSSVDWTNFDALSSGIFIRGPIKIALAAGPIERAGAGSKIGWVATGLSRNKRTDHCTGLWAFGTAQFLADLIHNTYNVSMSLGSLGPQSPSVVMYTWGTVGIIDMPSLGNITDEAYVRGPTVLPDFAPAPTPGPTPGPTLNGTIVIDLGSNSVLAPAHTILSPTATPGYSYDPATSTISGPAGLILVPPIAGQA